MEKFFCELHNTNIVVYNKEEENLFIDNNGSDVVIFHNDEGKKYLKRLLIGICDENCETVKQIVGV